MPAAQIIIKHASLFVIYYAAYMCITLTPPPPPPDMYQYTSDLLTLQAHQFALSPVAPYPRTKVDEIVDSALH